ncbi:unnamed protein product [Paramecium sonneborni]|uniref:Uncharacterized protein n=1 Tax=Paramecium sonneborni TaxID=65129 RepID=A0A8S1K990_9CILI|nr:unnamed protein product [Paramecium sonneborni]
MQQIIEPSGTLGDLLFSLQRFSLEDEKLIQYFGSRIINQNEIYYINYCTPLEKNLFLNYLINLFYSNDDIPKQDILYIDSQHNFNIPEHIFVGNCYSIEDIVIQLNSARYILKKNRKIRLIIIDSIHQRQKDNKRRTSRTIGEKILQFDREVEYVLEELINLLREFNAIVIVLCLMQYPQNTIKLSQNFSFLISEKIIGQLLENNIFLIPPLFYDQELYNYVQNKNSKNMSTSCISIMESKSKIKYYIFDSNQIIQTGEIAQNL